ncbi:50S ribosomal chloroplastic [Chlorella sorokiniana]|uniref:Large ribosomal subunit protein uL29c n=1 Tax=Chlorella sorokiniana TaxID=3076 RepID=A0A2P6U3V1_CHLSO|nr:50S ribosomal chloroplastic [Chlorella sorokiniana]|eukprot:PRW60985.1 50S ribosomal chloroplastic [Chlorella sorokiniana]
MALLAGSSVVALSSSRCVAQRPFAAAARLPARPAVQRLQVVAAKPTKAQEFRGMSNEDIDEAVQQCKRDMFSMRIKFAKREEWKPSDYKALKRKVAQLLTVRRERELAQGVDRRASKAAENRRLVEAGLGKFAS